MTKKSFILCMLLITLFPVFFTSTCVFNATASFIGSTETVTLYSVEDSYVNASSPDTNYGNSQYLYVRGNSTDLSHALIYVKFDLSSIPENAYIVSASMQLRFSGFSKLYYGILGGGDSVGAYYCSDNSWTELGVTWNNSPEFNSADTGRWYVTGPFAVYGYKSWDVTSDVTTSLPLREMTEVLKFTKKNDGYGYARYDSREASSQPKLEIEYTTEPVFEVQFESAQDVEATPYFPDLESNMGVVSFADETFRVPEVFDVATGSYAVDYSGGYDFVCWETTGGVTVLDNNAKSTTATVSGNGTLRAVGSAEILEYSYDTGTPTTDWSFDAGQICAEQFTPMLSGQLLSARYYVYNVSSPVESTFLVHVLDSEKEDLITPFEVTPFSDGWFDVDFTAYNLSLTEDTDFYVALEFLANDTIRIGGTLGSSRAYAWDGTYWNHYNNFMIRATVLNYVYPEPDETPPEIGVPLQDPPSDDVQAGEAVKISVDVTDAESGVKNVTLFYTINNGANWESQAMNYNNSTGLYEATIPGQEDGTLVEFRIEAYNNAEIKATKYETEPYYTYEVVPELSTFVILLTLTVATLVITFIEKRHPRLFNTVRQTI